MHRLNSKKLHLANDEGRRVQCARHFVLFVLVLAQLSIFSASSQTNGQREDTGQAQHLVVPLPSRLDGPISGDPDKPGAPFVLRIYNDANTIVPPHWHPEDEHIVVVKGTWSVGMGDKFDRSALRELNVGDYTFLPKKMRHFGWSRTECVVQVHGIGPFQIIPASPEEHLSGWKNTSDGWVRDPQATSFFKFRFNDRVRSKRGEGVIVAGMHSDKSQFMQYRIQKENGEPFVELEEDLVAVAQAKNLEAGPLNGEWDGIMHGFQGDSPFAFYFRQDTQKITGVLSLQWVGMALTSVTFRNNALEIHIDTPLGKFLFNGQLNQDTLSGEWSADTGMKGTWETKRVPEATTNK
jgi:Cupin